MFGNCATVVNFRVGGEDAKVLREEFSTAIAAAQLQDLPDYKSYVHTLMAAGLIGRHLVNTLPPTRKPARRPPAGASSAQARNASRVPAPRSRKGFSGFSGSDTLRMYSVNKGACDG